MNKLTDREILHILSNEVPYYSEDNLESIDEEVSDLDSFSNLCTEDLLDDFSENIDNVDFTKIISEFLSNIKIFL